MDQIYKNQVDLLLTVLPYVNEEKCFALHGGTAINLFMQEMPRLSVDIDPTYVPRAPRNESISGIITALTRIQDRVLSQEKGVRVDLDKETAKLHVSNTRSNIKIEANTTARGVLENPEVMELCERAQEAFDRSAEIQVVPKGQLYGGKICAALDRQHPRDLFDVKLLLDSDGYTSEVKQGFLYCLLSGPRPINELLRPNFQDQERTLQEQFAGMADRAFSYQDFEETRDKLISVVADSLTKEDKQFLLHFKSGDPDWSRYDFSSYPSVQWKLQNIRKLKEQNPDKHKLQYHFLASKLEDSSPQIPPRK